MKTPTHMLIGYAISKLLPGEDAGKVRWVILGAAAPDIPLIILVAACLVYMGSLTGCSCDIVKLVDYFYFENQAFIALHHLLHSPACLTFGAVAFWLVSRRCRWRDPRVFWFLAGAGSHAAVDLFTHARDGVLLFWPWSLAYRFNAGVDQWDMAGTGQILLMIEASLFLIYGLFFTWSRRRPFSRSLR